VCACKLCLFFFTNEREREREREDRDVKKRKKVNIFYLLSKFPWPRKLTTALSSPEQFVKSTLGSTKTSSCSPETDQRYVRPSNIVSDVVLDIQLEDSEESVTCVSNDGLISVRKDIDAPPGFAKPCPAMMTSIEVFAGYQAVKIDML
jgi:hypothetical protein